MSQCLASSYVHQAWEHRGVTGQTVEAFMEILFFYMFTCYPYGMNELRAGPKEMRPLIEELAGLAPCTVSATRERRFAEPLLPRVSTRLPERLAPSQLREWAQNGGGLNICRRLLTRSPTPGPHSSDF
jgi:methionine synthase I (cobalamin-dependent)